VPNLAPYQLATGKKDGNPLANGKPFVNNFLPTLGDMLRLNMSTPVTQRNDPKFSSLGLIAAAVAGLTAPAHNDTTLEALPNMDGFPNGRRLEDDVTRIELQAVGGVVLAAVGLWYDDYAGGANPVTPQLVNVLTFNAGPDANDMPFRAEWPYMAAPHRGYDYVKKLTTSTVETGSGDGGVLNMAAPVGFFVGQNYPNPAQGATTLRVHLGAVGPVTVNVYDLQGKQVATLMNERAEAGEHAVQWRPGSEITPGAYLVALRLDGRTIATTKVTVVK
jgi:hypothetical protein